MTEAGLLQFALYLIALVLLVRPLGKYMARVYMGKTNFLTRFVSPLEKLIYRISGINPTQSMSWQSYLAAMLFFNLAGLLVLYFLQRFQAFLPLNPQSFSGVEPLLAFNTAASFFANTNWQAYGGETTMSYFTQMVGLAVQNFVSAATGMALLIAFIRGLRAKESGGLGNFWVDTLRSTLYILLPLSFVLALALASQGVIQNFKPYQTVHTLEKVIYDAPQSNGKTIQQSTQEQLLPMGPVASQVAIKQLGSNGGGFFNTNSAYPFENPTPVSNFLEMLSLLLIPAALCYTFGFMIRNRRQGWCIFFAMLILFVPIALICMGTEQMPNPHFHHLGIETQPISELYPGANMEGKETRFGIASTALWATATTASSNGAVNGTLDSLMPLSGMCALWLMHLGEVAFGGLGSGLMSMLLLVILTVFIAGLMVGRTPEFLGKKIEPYEMKMTAIGVLVMPLVVLVFTAIGVITKTGISSLGNSGAHGFTEILYAFTSATNNNGSAFGGLNANTPFYNLLTGLAILIGRYWIAIPALAIAGSLANKKIIPQTSGTLPTDNILFVVLLVGVTIVLGALSFLPALALGPIVEHLMLWKTL